MLFRKGKKIVIAGSSQWGARLAGQLSGKGYDVVVVDSRRDAFRWSGAEPERPWRSLQPPRMTM